MADGERLSNAPGTGARKALSRLETDVMTLFLDRILRWLKPCTIKDRAQFLICKEQEAQRRGATGSTATAQKGQSSRYLRETVPGCSFGAATLSRFNFVLRAAGLHNLPRASADFGRWRRSPPSATAQHGCNLHQCADVFD